MRLDKFKVPDEIWTDKRIPVDAKYIYSYIYSKGMNRYIVDINVGELQQVIRITNTGLRKNLDKLTRLKKLKYYTEYATGMYSIKLN